MGIFYIANITYLLGNNKKLYTTPKLKTMFMYSLNKVIFI